MATFDELLGFSRPTEATYIGADRKTHTAAANEPRFTHDPITGKPQGLLIEEQRTNLLLWSEDFTQGYWDKSHGFVVPGTVTAPDGESLAYKFVGEAGESVKRLSRFTSVEPDTTYTQSWYVKSAGVRYCSTYFRSSEIGNYNDGNTLVVDLETGEFSAGSGITASIIRLPDGWFRISISGTTNGDPVSMYSVVTLADSLELVNAPSITGDGTSGIYIWGAQLEAGSQPSSYIKTESTQVTRAADNVSRELGAEFNASEGCIFVESSASGENSYSTLVAIGSSNSDRLLIAFNGTTDAIRFVRYDSAGNTDVSLGNLTRGSNFRAAMSWSASTGILACAVNGEATTLTGVSFTETPAPEMFLNKLSENDPTFRASGANSDVRHLPRALSEQELIALTTPEA